MEVRLFPNLRRPNVGLKPRREAQRPLLPQHARHCPVLEAGSSVGFLVYPPLEQHESFYVGYEGEGRYPFRYYVKPDGGNWEALFSLLVSFPVGGIGKFKEDLSFTPGAPPMSRELALHIARCCFVPEDLNTPPGAVTLRGAWNFQTQTGWDTVYSSIFNAIERPSAPMLVVRVETDWYAQESEFRYVLQPGEGISVTHSMPIGQAFFVPREPITLVDCSDEQVAVIRRTQQEFSREKAAVELTTAYGVPYSPHYLRKSRSLSSSAQALDEQTPAPAAAAAISDQLMRKTGRNDPCPCGSGKKYKKCHGEDR